MDGYVWRGGGEILDIQRLSVWRVGGVMFFECHQEPSVTFDGSQWEKPYINKLSVENAESLTFKMSEKNMTGKQG